jgi:hypothetical protein
MSSDEAITNARPRNEAFVVVAVDERVGGARFTARKDGVEPLVTGKAEGVVGFSIRWRLSRTR